MGFREEKDHDMNICQDTCSICLEEYDQGECIRVLPCGHTFHSSCIFPWLTERSPTCPLCKAYFHAVPSKGDCGDSMSRDADGAEEESAHDEADAPHLPPVEEELPARRSFGRAAGACPPSEDGCWEGHLTRVARPPLMPLRSHRGISWTSPSS